MRMPIAALGPAILRHLQAYADVAGEDLRDAVAFISKRLLSLLVAAAAGVIALLMICAWVLVLAWDTPWRAWVAAGLALGFGIVAFVLAIPALRHGRKPQGVFFSRIRAELDRDRGLLERAFSDDKGREHTTSGRATNGSDKHATDRI